MAGVILCGMDGSESAKRAARLARRLSSRLGLRLVFMHVVEAGSPKEKIDLIAARLQHLSDGCTEVDCGAEWLVDIGHPVDRLIAAAEDEGASFIVVGSQGPRSSLLGSISADISRRAPCPVVVVPPGGRPAARRRRDTCCVRRRRRSLRLEPAWTAKLGARQCHTTL